MTSGRGLALLDSLLAPQEVKDLYETAFSLKLAGLEISSGDPVASQMAGVAQGDAGDIAWGGCAAGVAGITILPDGTALPCRRLPIPLGNLREDSFREIWATSPVLEALRDRSRYHGKCRACPRWALCRDAMSLMGLVCCTAGSSLYHFAGWLKFMVAFLGIRVNDKDYRSRQGRPPSGDVDKSWPGRLHKP